MIISEKISQEKLKNLADSSPGALTKVVVDLEKEILALGCELHIDCADELLEAGSQTKNLWGANVYLSDKTIDFVSLINIRPADNNRSMEIQSEHIKGRVEEVIRTLLF